MVEVERKGALEGPKRKKFKKNVRKSKRKAKKLKIEGLKLPMMMLKTFFFSTRQNPLGSSALLTALNRL